MISFGWEEKLCYYPLLQSLIKMREKKKGSENTRQLFTILKRKEFDLSAKTELWGLFPSYNSHPLDEHREEEALRILQAFPEITQEPTKLSPL